MAQVPSGATLPKLTLRGTHAEVGAGIGRALRSQIHTAVEAARTALRAEQGLDERGLAQRMAPALEAAERWTPQLVTELRARADAAEVPFALMAYLSAGGLPPHVGGCTSVVVHRADGSIVLGHTEDSLVPAPDELFLLEAAVTEASPFAGRLLALCLVGALPGCSAGLNAHGLAVLMDYLPDPDARMGLGFDFLTRALLAQPSVEAALDFLGRTPRGGSGNLLLAQAGRVVNLELTSTRMAQVEVPRAQAWAHANHFLDPVLAQAAGAVQEDSPPRCSRAQALAHAQLDAEGMKRLLSDRVGAPHSICRERTLGAFVAQLPEGRVQVCWGEPEQGTWTRHALRGP
jgi:isopenicillin-N N-acyltransferase like protein